jgi:NAD(P)-dependent dehydrogenase (short-subunit alcohol dehydrogenase family)
LASSPGREEADVNAVSARVAVVTGAGAGIGRAVSLALAADGFDLALVGRRHEPLALAAAEITRLGRRALVAAADVSNPRAVHELFSRIEVEFGRLDLLFNNAGINARPAALEDLTPQEWQAVIDVNITGAFLCIQQAFRLMKSQLPRGGRIINNGSVSAITPRPHSAPYTASKHALTGLTKAAALEGRGYDIACGQIDIGNVATAMGVHIMQGTLQADGSMVGEPTMHVQHVVEAVRYMASLPLDANVLSLTVMATGMPLVGRG